MARSLPLVLLLLAASSSVSAPAAVARLRLQAGELTTTGKPCAEGCTVRGNCNIEDGRCECAMGMGGEYMQQLCCMAAPLALAEKENVMQRIAFDNAMLPACSSKLSALAVNRANVRAAADACVPGIQG